MVISKFTSGVNTTFSSELNDNYSKVFSLNILNSVRQMQDRLIIFSQDTTDLWCEAYVDSNGQGSSVDTTLASTTAVFDTDKYYFNENIRLATETNNSSSGYVSDASSTTVTGTIATTGFFSSLKVHGRDSSTWSVWTVEIKKGSDIIASDTFEVSHNTQYILNFLASDYSEMFENGDTFSIVLTRTGGSNTIRIDDTGTIDYVGTFFSYTNQNIWNDVAYTIFTQTETATTNTISHDIPSGTFSSTTSSLIGKALVSDWESGASIQHKITNATEDSGWITDGEIGSFTAFTSEPTHYFVKLTPKSTSPTAGYPSIKGSGVIAE